MFVRDVTDVSSAELKLVNCWQLRKVFWAEFFAQLGQKGRLVAGFQEVILYDTAILFYDDLSGAVDSEISLLCAFHEFNRLQVGKKWSG